MISKKIVYVTKDGSQFDTEELAQVHLKRIEFEDNLLTFIKGKDLIGSRVDTVYEFITENAKELYSVLSPMFEEKQNVK